jgi:hypothetical protein
MDRAEANALAESHLEPYRTRSFAALLPLLSTSEPFDGTTPEGLAYSGKIYAVWDGHPHQNLRVWSHVAWGGSSDSPPACVTFIIAPDGTLVGA